MTNCTCPSGDGSLRWPCPAHPPTPAAAIDEILRALDLARQHYDFDYLTRVMQLARELKQAIAAPQAANQGN
ncbi:hypothetical protein [Alcaligenes endophyticus]|uniref:Uncharacterized protein n=1 Tax=Alcaligenes endophyticus TaxID=1929088 RepID=A0ABT8ENV5_9BURK|nr:hypothetical protein [Alcaligenes endophyticus]MCX5592842.1 hypothetical protein [Alcaligenes endophyticus]MDN4122867.1 hypothetical protein [Alcaligenes endophyticus]